MKHVSLLLLCCLLLSPALMAVPKVAQFTLSGDLVDWNYVPALFGQKRPPCLIELLDGLEKAGKAEDVTGVLVVLDYPSAGFSQWEELGLAISDLRAKGKHTYVYSAGYSTGHYFFAGHFDTILCHRSGLMTTGINLESMYFKDMLKKIGAQAQVVAIKEYKSAGDMLTRSQMSQYQKEQLNALLDTYEAVMAAALEKNRNMDRKAYDAFMDKGFISAAKAKELGYLDALVCEFELKKEIRKLELDGQAGKVIFTKAYDPGEKKEKLEFATLLKSMMGAKTDDIGYVPSPAIAVISLSGMIAPGSEKAQHISGKKAISLLDQVADKKAVKAVVLRVDSPGGSAMESDEIYQKIEQVRKKKPLVVSMGNVAASGGYFISCNADKILADDTTITGSIGVVTAKVSLKGTAGKLGISIDSLRRGRHAGAFSLYKLWNAEELKLMEDFAQECYQDFISKVAAGRNMTTEQVNEIGRGRVWSGQTAQTIGLVDETGGLRAAIAQARELAGISQKPSVVYLPKKLNMLEFLLQEMGNQAFAPAGLSQLAARYKQEIACLLTIFTGEYRAMLMPMHVTIR